jgi:hypothetical protein
VGPSTAFETHEFCAHPVLCQSAVKNKALHDCRGADARFTRRNHIYKIPPIVRSRFLDLKLSMRAIFLLDNYSKYVDDVSI